MRIGVRLGPIWVSTSTRSRRKRRSSQPSWHAKGQATTPDGREVDFRCHHSHRSQDAAINCAATIRKQIERGQSLHLITRVRSTPASREAARQRAAEQEARRKAKAAERTQATQQRSEQREARRQARAAERAQAAQQHTEQREARRLADAAQRTQAAQYRAKQAESRVIQRPPAVEQYPQFVQGTRQRIEHRRADTSYPPVGQPPSLHQRGGERPSVDHRYAVPSRQRSLGWPVIGLIAAGATTILGFVLAVMAGNNPKSGLATTAGGIITLGILGVLVCAIAALLQRRTKLSNAASHPPMPASQDFGVPRPAPSFTSPTVYAPGAYPGPAAAGPSPYGVPLYGDGSPWPPRQDGPPWPPHGDSTPWPR